MADFKWDWDKMAGDVKDLFLDGAKGLLEGAKEDLEEFGKDIAKDVVRAAREGREDLLSELGHQVAALGEVHRIRLVNATWDQIKQVLEIVGKTAIKVVAAAAL